MSDAELPVPYSFSKLPLTPQGMEALILELLDGELVARTEITERINSHHLQHGGLPSRAADLPRSVKRALENLRDQGLASNPQHGFWMIGSADSTTVTEMADVVTPEESGSDQITADLVLGAGDGAVYIYYLPTYRKQAEVAGKNTWPCKVGRTSKDPLQRILSQAATALPETPRVAIILRTPLPVVWERAIHSVLAARDAQIADAPGVEWFDTSPDIILDIIQFISPELINSQG